MNPEIPNLPYNPRIRKRFVYLAIVVVVSARFRSQSLLIRSVVATRHQSSRPGELAPWEQRATPSEVGVAQTAMVAKLRFH
jgi:hypothetical protein